MKNKALKLLSVLLCAGIVFSLCGCTQLDNMRASTGYLQDKNTISFNGKTYKSAPKCAFYNKYTTQSISVAKKDVPLLVANLNGYGYSINTEETLIFDDTAQKTFVAKDLLESVTKRVENGELFNALAYTYYGGENDMYDIFENLKEKDCATVKSAIEASVSNPVNSLPDDAYFHTDVYNVSKDGIFAQTLGGFYKIIENEKITGYIYYIYNDDGSEYYYGVPAIYTEELTGIFAKAD